MSGTEKKEKVKKDAKKTTAGAAKAQVPIDLEPPTGTRDFFPADMRQQRYLFDKFREVARLYGFQEYDAPVLEHEDLYKRKAGEEITQQMYNFVDKDDARVTLRPEMTPSLARMVLQLMRAETGEMSVQLPLKWFSIPQCWRYETTQRGRKREHYQWNMDIVGEKGIMAEVELLSAVCTFFERVGITSNDVGLKVNSRKVLGAVMKNAGVPDDKFAETCVVLDKQDKIGADAVVKEFVETIGLSLETATKIVNATTATTLDEFAELAGVADSDEVKELRKLFELADDYGFGDWLQFDASVIRGLAYYTGVVFEGFDKAGVLRAICGGGRYDRLLSLYGSPKEVPCIGFGFGDCVIAELLKEKGVVPDLPQTIDFVVAAFSADYMGKALSVARQLRLAGKSVDIYTEPGKKLGKAYNYADRIGARKLALVAPAEWEKGLVRVKDLRQENSSALSDDEKQKDVPFKDLANIDSYFGGSPAALTGNTSLPASAPTSWALLAPSCHDDAHASLLSLCAQLGTVAVETPQAASAEAETASWAKSLFLKDKKTKSLFMVTSPATAEVSLKALAVAVGVKELRMASPEDMKGAFGLDRGCVTAMSVATDAACSVTSVVDSRLLEHGAPRLRMCTGCNDALDHSQHHISEQDGASLLQFLAACGHLPLVYNATSNSAAKAAAPPVPQPAPKAAPAAAAPKAAAAASAAAGAATPPIVGPALEAFLVEHAYVGGSQPSAHDRNLFNELKWSSSAGTLYDLFNDLKLTPALARWYGHIESFPNHVRNSWS